MHRLFRKFSSLIAIAMLLAIASFNLLPTAAFSQGFSEDIQSAITPATRPEVPTLGQMTHHQMQPPMQMSGEMLALMGEMQQLMSTLTPEKMQEFRPYMMAHHTRMVEEMKAMLEQLQEIANDTDAG